MDVKHRRQLVVFGAVSLLFCIGGVVLIVLGIGRFMESRAFVSGAKTAPGTVVGFETYDAVGVDLSDDIHYAMIAYTTKDGRRVKFRGPSKDGLVRLKGGDDVRVLYYPGDPQEARVDSFMGLWFAATMLWVVGVGAVLIPALTMWQAWKWVKKQEGGADA